MNVPSAVMNVPMPVMNLPMVERIVSALLYEGYLLYPYRASAVKNQMRFNFGVVYPPAYVEAQSGNDACTIETQCLVTGGASTRLAISVRFLRMANRSGSGAPGGHILNWQEAAEDRVDLPLSSLELLSAAPLRHNFILPQSEDRELLRDSLGQETGAIVRTREAIRGVIEARAEPVSGNVSRLTVRIENASVLPAGAETNRDAALAFSLVSTHTVLRIENGEFVSLLEPPMELRAAASECRNQGTWPVLGGRAGM